MAVTFVLHDEKELTINLAVTWELLGLAAILSGAVPKFSGWSSRLSLGSLAVLLLTGFLVVWGMYQMTIQISSLLMKNQELAMQVSLLNQENERIIKELERLNRKAGKRLMKKILFVINTLGRAGAETALLELLNHLDTEKYEISLYVLLGQGEMISRVPPEVHIKTKGSVRIPYSPVQEGENCCRHR